MVYQVVWSPRKPGVFASASGDTTLRMWDARASAQAMQTYAAHSHEILSCDWSKYNEHLIVTGSVDKTIRGFDTRAGQVVQRHPTVWFLWLFFWGETGERGGGKERERERQRGRGRETARQRDSETCPCAHTCLPADARSMLMMPCVRQAGGETALPAGGAQLRRAEG